MKPFQLAVLLLAIRAAGAGAEGALPAHNAADPKAPVVAPANLLSSERFWPYQTSLTRAWKPDGSERTLAPGIPGVLIRVEPGGIARIDFGRDGLHAVPVAETDVIERANAVRRGELRKLAPNFVLAIGPRLADPMSTAGPVRAFDLARVSEHRVFLCVFADPAELDALRGALEPLAARSGLLTILFPQGEYPDATVRDRLRALGWSVPFVLDHLSEPYARTLLLPGTRLPAVLLQTGEGRVLFQKTWSERVGRDLMTAVDEALGPAAVSGR
jgi:hypothetical protein